MEKYLSIGEIRSTNEGRTISGKAVSFETESNNLGFIEILHRGCITEDTINKSNIIFNYNHNRDEILARSKNGNGSLHISVEEDGVYFEFDSPNTRFGDEILEQVRRGDLCKCSFAFTMPDNSSSQSWHRRSDGLMQRDVYEIEELFDLSVVVDEAYSDTYIQARSAELAKAEEEEEEEKKEEIKEEEENDNSELDNTDDDNDNDNESEDEEVKEEEEEREEETEEETENDEERSNININKNIKHNIMEKKFSLLGAIRAIANNQQLDETTQAVINAGATECRNAGVEFGGQIQLPNMAEMRSPITVTAEGEDVVVTNIFDILEPLRGKNVLIQAGAKYMTGLVGNVQVPIMTAANVTWEGETSTASDGAGAFSHVTLSPKRLTAYIDISKQFLAQDSIGAEAVIRQDLINAINTKLEQTILGYEDGTTAQPGGLRYNVTVNDIYDFQDLTDLEAEVEGTNTLGECKYIVNPVAKSYLRNAPKSALTNELIMTNGEIDGTPVLCTTNLINIGGSHGNVLYGDFSNVAIGQWGAIDLTVDPYTVAKDGKVRLVINAFFDGKLLREGTIVTGWAREDSNA